MAISIHWPSSVITVNQSDCTFVSGTFYTLNTDNFRLALKALEDDAEGIIHQKTHNHNTTVTIAGTEYYRSIEILPPYTVQFLPDTNWSVQLEGSNNNIWSVGDGILVQNNVQVIPTNTAGGQVVSIGSGLSAEEHDQLMAIPLLGKLIAFFKFFK